MPTLMDSSRILSVILLSYRHPFLRCLNEGCKKESCRCLSHIPLRCSEIEYDRDVKMRTYIENRMTEVLLQKCRKCTKVFIKESGYNKMTYPCGASMCYVCEKSIRGGYTHFDTALGCPLYTKDLNIFHVCNCCDTRSYRCKG